MLFSEEGYTGETNVAVKQTPAQSRNLCVLRSTASSQSSGMSKPHAALKEV